MILIALAGVCLLSVPLTGGRLSRLADVRARGTWLPVTALALQVLITTLLPNGSPELHKLAHIGTYALIGLFLGVNRRIAGVLVIAAGALLNALAIVLNGGIMPASLAAQRIAGVHVEAGFQNSAAVAHPVLPWLGDVIPWPGPLPNVLSIGDCVVYAGMAIALHAACRRSAAGTIRLTPLAAAIPARAAGPLLNPRP
jgi:hypothetical protein